MYLEKLNIYSDGKVIRSVKFKQGLNLVIDESPQEMTESGNSVGKTTVLRAVDFCLGSDGKDFYTDNESKAVNQSVHQYLHDHNFRFELFLRTKKGNSVKIERSISGDVKINDAEVESDSDYKQALSRLVLGYKGDKPSIRQFVAKFVRKSHHAMSNTLKFNHVTTLGTVYEVVYLVLFGFADIAVLGKRMHYVKLIKKLKDRRSAILGDRNLSSYKQAKELIQHEISEIENQVKSLRIDKAHESELEEVTQLQYEISDITQKISELRMRMKLNADTLQGLEESRSTVDVGYIEKIYKEAETLNVNLQKRLQEVVSFHNALIGEKSKLIKEGIAKLDKTIAELDGRLQGKLSMEKDILQKMDNKDVLKDYKRLWTELNEQHKLLGEETKIITLIQSIDEELEVAKTEQSKVNEAFSKHIEQLDANIQIFNRYFSKYSKELYEESYVFSMEFKSDKLKYNIDNVGGNVGGGKKKVQVAAFDLAYIAFQNEIDGSMPRFVMHDSVEDVHSNQIATLFGIASASGGQYVVSLLADKVGFLGPDFLKENVILKLSESDKFFRF